MTYIDQSIEKQTDEVLSGWLKAGLTPQEIKRHAWERALQYRKLAKGMKQPSYHDYYSQVAESYEQLAKAGE